MFVYFIQRKGFLDGNVNYLGDRLRRVRAEVGQGHFHSFYRRFLRRLFHEGLGQPRAARGAELDVLLGDVPYLNGSLFAMHELEEANPEIDIPDEAFVRRGEIQAVDDLVTHNLDIRQFMQDVIDTCGGPELLRAIWQGIVGRVPEKAHERFRHGIAIRPNWSEESHEADRQSSELSSPPTPRP